MEKLTKPEEMCRFIFEFMDGKGRSPTIREIAAGVRGKVKGENLSTSIVDYNLNILTDAGIIKRERNESRGISIIDSKYIVPDIEEAVKKIKEHKQL